MPEEQAAAAAGLEHETVMEAREPPDEGDAPAVAGLVEAAPLDGLEQAAESHRLLQGRLERVVARVEGEQTLGTGQGVEGGRAALVTAEETVGPAGDSVVIADALVEGCERARSAEEAGHQSLKASSRKLTRWARSSAASSRGPIFAVARMARRRLHMAGRRNSAAPQARRMRAISLPGDCSSANLPAAPRRDRAA